MVEAGGPEAGSEPQAAASGSIVTRTRKRIRMIGCPKEGPRYIKCRGTGTAWPGGGALRAGGVPFAQQPPGAAGGREGADRAGAGAQFRHLCLAL